MKKLLLSLLVLGALAHAETDCTLVQSGDMDIAWKAFKTPLKVGVGGTFTKHTYTPAAKEAKDLKALLVGSTVTIDTTSVNSGNAPRDAKLVTYFFKKMTSGSINGKVTDITIDTYIKDQPRTGIVTVLVTMNGKQVSVPMRYTYADKVFAAKGTIDLADFSSLDALSSINKACFDLHKGKTWSDVEVGFKTHIDARGCSSADGY